MGGIIVDGKSLSRAAKYDKGDLMLFKDLHGVFVKYGLKDRVISVESGCGMPRPPMPPIRCHRVCVLGPDDRPISTWICR